MMSATPLPTPRTVVTLTVYCGYAFSNAGATLLVSQSLMLVSSSVHKLITPPPSAAGAAVAASGVVPAAGVVLEGPVVTPAGLAQAARTSARTITRTKKP